MVNISANALIGPVFFGFDVHRRRAANIIVGFTENIWDIASAPLHYSSLPKVAFATSNGLWVYDIADGTVPSPPRKDRGWPQEEQMAVAFQDTNVVMSGQRSGRVSLTDTRVPGSVYRIQHSSSVNGITKARTNSHIIVSGLQSTAMYDLRYTREIDNTVMKRPKRRAKNQTPVNSSKPFVSFNVTEDRMSSHYGRGKPLAYISNHDIAVVATCRNPARGGAHLNKVTLYQVSSGKILPGPLTDSPYFPEILDIKVGRVRDGVDSIFVATDRRLFEWSVDLLEVEHRGHI